MFSRPALLDFVMFEKHQSLETFKFHHRFLDTFGISQVNQLINQSTYVFKALNHKQRKKFPQLEETQCGPGLKGALFRVHSPESIMIAFLSSGDSMRPSLP